ncbi:MAG: pyridoxal phosphate-dependent aminotransferase [Halobacteriota archaeon]|nr:pyridoxal phosphate-dependent aminotransferase [Halobacteriota archaeon]
MTDRDLSERLNKIEESATIKIIQKQKEMKKAGIDVISFGVGEPDFATPMHICEAAKDALYEGFTHYTPSAGIPELREAIADKLKSENGIDVGPEGVLVTPGAKHAIYETCMAVLNAGDEAILLSPAWVTYDACIKLPGGKTVWGQTRDDGINDLSEAVTKKTKLIIVNSPSNPAGYVLHDDEIKTISDIAIDNDLYLISDEIYEKIIYDKKCVSFATLGGMDDRTITINGFSKTYAMTGWRMGYATAPPRILKNMLKLQQHSVSCATSFAQVGAVAALKGPQDCLDEMVAEFRKRRDLIVEGLNKIGLKCDKPDGAFYVFPDVSSFGTGSEVAERLLEVAHVAVTPGFAFGSLEEDYVRVSYATSVENISEGLQRIEEALN